MVTKLAIVAQFYCFSSGCTNDNKASFDNSCQTSQDCPPGQVCALNQCTKLDEGHLLGSFECILDDPEANAGKCDFEAKLGGSTYSISKSVSCVTDPSVDYEYSITAFGITDSSGSNDWVTIFQENITGSAGKPKALTLAKIGSSDLDSGYISSVVDGQRVIVGWIESGFITLDQDPPASGTTVSGIINARLRPAKEGNFLSTPCTVVSDCGNDITAHCSPLIIEDGPKYCWSRCDDDPTICGPNGACIGLITGNHVPRQFCVAACVNDGCVNTALSCHTSTNGVKGCY